VSTSKNNMALPAANIVAFAATLVVNGLANTTVFGGKTTAQVSDLNPTLITPAGYVFGIWGIIYTLLLVFLVYQTLPSQRDKPFIKEVSYLFILSCVLNISWIFLWQYGYIALSVAPIVGMLATLAAIYLWLNIGKSSAPRKEKVFVHLPFSVYFAWITVATVACIAAAAYSAGWTKWEPADAVWGIVALAAVLAVTLTVVATQRDVAYGLVAIWALVGIAVRQTATPNVVYTAEIGAAIVAAATIAAVLVSTLKRKKKPS